MTAQLGGRRADRSVSRPEFLSRQSSTLAAAELCGWCLRDLGARNYKGKLINISLRSISATWKC